LNKDGEFIDTGLQDAIVHEDEAQALKLAQSVFGRVVKVHHEFVEQLSVEIEP